MTQIELGPVLAVLNVLFWLLTAYLVIGGGGGFTARVKILFPTTGFKKFLEEYEQEVLKNTGKKVFD